MLLLASYNLARAVVVYVCRAEERLGVAGSERREPFQVVMQFLRYVAEVDFGVDVEHRLCLFGLYVLVYISLESVAELLDVVPTQRQSGCVGVSAEVDEQVAATLDSRVDVEARHAACRTRSEVAVASEHYGRAEVDFGES